MVEGVSWTYCGQCRFRNTYAKENITTTHINRSVTLYNQWGENHPAAPTDSPDTTDGVPVQDGPANNTSGGVNLKSNIAADLGGDPGIGGDSVYDGVSLSLMGHLFIGGDITSESKTYTSNDVYVGAPEFYSDDLFFRYDFRDKLDADVFYD